MLQSKDMEDAETTLSSKLRRSPEWSEPVHQGGEIRTTGGEPTSFLCVPDVDGACCTCLENTGGHKEIVGGEMIVCLAMYCKWACLSHQTTRISYRHRKNGHVAYIDYILERSCSCMMVSRGTLTAYTQWLLETRRYVPDIDLTMRGPTNDCQISM